MRVLVTRTLADVGMCWGRLSDGRWLVEVQRDALKPPEKRDMNRVDGEAEAR